MAYRYVICFLFPKIFIYERNVVSLHQKIKRNKNMKDKIYLWSAHEKNNCFKHYFCYARKEYTTEQVENILKESNEFKDCTEIVVRPIDEHEIAGVCAYQRVINLQPSTDEMWLVRKLINKTK